MSCRVEQELMARIIAEMYEKRIADPLRHGMEAAAADNATEVSSVVSDADADESFMG